MKMQCWMPYSDSHGLLHYDSMWLPQGEFPDFSDNFERVPALDYETEEPRRLNLKGKSPMERLQAVEEFKKRHPSVL